MASTSTENTTTTTANNTTLPLKSYKYKKYQEIKENENFLYKLKEFHKLRGTPIVSFPSLNGKPIDLHSLYLKVTASGGWEKVCEKEKWADIAKDFNINANCANGSYGLKNIYLRYLSLYERVNFFGEDTTSKDDDDDNSRRKFSNILHSIPMTYNVQQHLAKLSEINKSPHVKQFEKFELSLICGLPNEIDFAFNTLVLLSSTTDNIDIDLLPSNQANSIRLIDLLLAHVGFFDNDLYGYRKLYDEWRVHANRNFVKFWHDTIETEDEYILGLMPKLHNKTLKDLPSQDLLNLRQDCGLTNVEAHRIEQTMVIINNFSFDEKNLEYLCKSKTLIRFLLLSSYSTYNDIRKLSLDILSNLSKKIALTGFDGSETKAIFNKIQTLVESKDRYEIIRGLEILTKLCMSTSKHNDQIIKTNLNDKFYEVINQLLTVQDLLILTYSLECLYELSQFSDDYVCVQLLNSSKSVISLLINYLTVDAAHLSSKSIKVVEIIQPTGIDQQYNQHHHHHHHQQQQQQTQSPVPMPPVVHNKFTVANPIASPINLHKVVNQQLKQQLQPFVANSNSQEQQARGHVCTWLKSCFAVSTVEQLPISKTELYCFYKGYAKTNNLVILSIPVFFDILQSTFPQIRTDDNKNAIYGLKTVNSNQQASQPASVISQPSMQTVPQTVIIQIKPPAMAPLIVSDHCDVVIKTQVPVSVSVQQTPSLPSPLHNNDTTSCPTPPPTIIKTQTLSINESSCSSDLSSSSASSHQSNKTTNDNHVNNGHVKLEKVGEAVPAYNLCVEMKTEEIQCAKIERLINNAVKLNGSTDVTYPMEAVNHNNGTSKHNGDDHKLVNGYGHDNLDKDHEQNGITSPNGKCLLNGKIQSKSMDIIDKLNDELNASKIIKRKIQNDLVVSDELKSPKKKTKKINEMNLAPITTSTLGVVLNKPSQVSTTNHEHQNGIVVQQQPVQPQQNPPITSNLHVKGMSNNQQSALNTAFVNNNLAANAHIVPPNQSTHSQPIYIKFDYMCEWNNCKM